MAGGHGHQGGGVPACQDHLLEVDRQLSPALVDTFLALTQEQKLVLVRGLLTGVHRDGLQATQPVPGTRDARAIPGTEL